MRLLGYVYKFIRKQIKLTVFYCTNSETKKDVFQNMCYLYTTVVLSFAAPACDIYSNIAFIIWHTACTTPPVKFIFGDFGNLFVNGKLVSCYSDSIQLYSIDSRCSNLPHRLCIPMPVVLLQPTYGRHLVTRYLHV